MAAESPHAGSWVSYPSRLKPVITHLGGYPMPAHPHVHLSVHEALTRAVCETYAGDALAPSVTTSYLKTPQEGYYASIRRYPTASNGAPFVVCSVDGADTLEAALEQLAKKWLDFRGDDFRGKLTRVLNGEAVYR